MKNIKISLLSALKSIYIIIFLLGILSLVWLSWFLYINFYQTLTTSNELLFLKKEVVVNDIDVEEFDRIIELLNKKIEEKKEGINLNF